MSYCGKLSAARTLVCSPLSKYPCPSGLVSPATSEGKSLWVETNHGDLTPLTKGLTSRGHVMLFRSIGHEVSLASKGHKPGTFPLPVTSGTTAVILGP